MVGGFVDAPLVPKCSGQPQPQLRIILGEAREDRHGFLYPAGRKKGSRVFAPYTHVVGELGQVRLEEGDRFIEAPDLEQGQDLLP